MNKNISILKLDKSIKYPPSIWPKIRSLLLIDNLGASLVEKAIVDKNLRDFLFVNIQGIGHTLYDRYKIYMEAQDYEETIYLFRKFGFLDDKKIEKEEELSNFLFDLTNEFASKIGFLKNQSLIKFGSDRIKHLEEYLKSPLKIMLEETGFKNKVSATHFNIDDINLQNLFSAWQDKTIFERIIAKLIEKELNCKVHCSLYIVVDDLDPLKNSLEFDNIFVYNNKICFLELKNGNINRSRVFEFLGKIKIVKEKYGIEVDKIAVIGTGTKDPFFNNLKMSNMKIFDIEDYRDDFKEFFKFIKS